MKKKAYFCLFFKNLQHLWITANLNLNLLLIRAREAGLWITSRFARFQTKLEKEFATLTTLDFDPKPDSLSCPKNLYARVPLTRRGLMPCRPQAQRRGNYPEQQRRC